MNTTGACDCVQSLAGALGGVATGQGLVDGSTPAPIVDCPWCGMPSVEPELADVTAFSGPPARS
jgi:hypothetical protein